MVDVQNTLVNYPIARYGSDEQQATYLPRLTSENGRRVRALGSRLRLRRVRPRDARREARRSAGSLNGRKLWITNGAEAGVFVVFANANPSAGYKGITAFIVERGFTGFTVGKKEDKLGIRASSTTRAAARRLRRARRERARRGGQGLQDRDRDAERGTHRHRRADDRRRAAARSTRPSST